MSAEGRSKNWEVWGVAIVVSVAVIVGLFFKGITGESISDSVKDIGGALIPIIAAFVAAKLVTREMDPADRFVRAGEEALKKIQEKHPNILSGPKANREGSYDPKNPGGAGRYLFIQNKRKGQKGQLVPILPLKEGVVEVRVPMTSLLVLGYKREGLEEVQGNCLLKVRSQIESILSNNKYDETFEILEHKHKDIAIAVDFDETQMGSRAFGKAVTACTNAALHVLLPLNKS